VVGGILAVRDEFDPGVQAVSETVKAVQAREDPFKAGRHAEMAAMHAMDIYLSINPSMVIEVFRQAAEAAMAAKRTTATHPVSTLIGTSTRQFRRDALRIIRADPNHPSSFST